MSLFKRGKTEAPRREGIYLLPIEDADKQAPVRRQNAILGLTVVLAMIVVQHNWLGQTKCNVETQLGRLCRPTKGRGIGKNIF
jgi:hypothetical protein